MFIAFRVPYSPAIGVKLISTPWTDKNLEHTEGITAEQLRQEHRSKGIPDDLANILELAGQADVRILILDADAPVLLACRWPSPSKHTRRPPSSLPSMPACLLSGSRAGPIS